MHVYIYMYIYIYMHIYIYIIFFLIKWPFNVIPTITAGRGVEILLGIGTPNMTGAA